MRARFAALALCAWAPAGAQAGREVPCRGQRIDAIRIVAQGPSEGTRRIPLVTTLVREAHVRTRREVIRGYLQLRAGDPCTELRRAESERLLRAQPFIADATVEAVTNRRGNVDLEVRTIDEASIVVGASVGTGAPAVRGARLGTGNLSGLGIAATLGWRYHPTLEDRMELRVSDYQFAGRPVVLSFATIRDPLGRDDHAELTLPFRTDLQRLAWRVYAGENRNYAQFAERDSGRLLLGYNRDYAEAGFIGRIGPPGKLSLVGLSFTNERTVPDSAAQRLHDLGLSADTAAEFAGRFRESSAARVNLLVGVRGIRFRRMRGLDALRGTQDVPVGVQFGTLIGRGVPALGSRSNDLFLASDLFAGLASTRVVYRLQLQGEARRADVTNAWDGLVGSGRASRYSRVSNARTRVWAGEWTGTWRVLVPHALSLGTPDGGVRGIRDTRIVGGRRAVVRVNEQLFLGAPFSVGDFGIALFADAGKLWAGDVPYGETTPVRASAGASLLLAVPMRSTRMWRLEFAAPINREPGGARWELRLSHSDRTAFFWREPGDIDAARARAVPASIYTWP